MPKIKFTSASKKEPCQVCGRTDYCKTGDNDSLWCVSYDGLNLKIGDIVNGYRANAIAQEWMIFNPADDCGRKLTKTELEENRKLARIAKEEAIKAELPLSERHKYYLDILNQLPLKDHHRANLNARGLSDYQIEKLGYRSIEPFQNLKGDFPENLPGYNLSRNSLTNKYGGILCPIWQYGRIAGFKIRLDDNDVNKSGHRYTSLSSQKFTSYHLYGEQPLAVLPGANGEIWVTEGNEIKPAIVNQKFGKTVLGGARYWHKSPNHTAKYLTRIKELYGDKIILSLDAGDILNQRLHRHWIEEYKFFESQGFKVKFAWWGQVSKDDCDIDELTDFRRIEYIFLDEFLSKCNRGLNDHKSKVIDAILKAGNDSKLTNLDREISKDKWEYRQLLNFIITQAEQLKSQSSIQPSIQPNQPKKLDVDIWFSAEDRGKIYQQVITDEKYQDYKYILDISTTGAGKSHHIGTLEPSNLEADKLFYISNEHRNPTTPTIEANYTDLPARNDGLYQDENGKVYWPKDGQEANITGNCGRSELFRKLASKGYQHEANTEASLNPICNTCKFKFNCSGYYPDGKEANYIPGNSFRQDRKNALLADKIRCHIDSLGNDIPDNSIAFVDEFSRQINPVEITEVSLTDYQKTITNIATELPEVWELIKDFISPLHEYLSYSHKEAYHGYAHLEVMQIFGNINKADIPQIVEQLKLLNPDLESYFEKADTLEDYKGLSGAIIKTIKSGLSKLAFKESHELLDDLTNNWIIPLLEVYGGLVTGNFRIKNHKLIIASKNTRQVESLAKFKKVFLLETTATRENAALELGIKPNEILIICEQLPNYSNLEIVHITDLGLQGKNRSDTKNAQIVALTNGLQSKHENLGVIDHLACKAVGFGHWFKDNRGSNDFLNCDAMLMIGTPYQDIGAIAQRYSILTGDFDISKDNPDFQKYLNHQVTSEIIQGNGRPRANRRPDQKITVYFTTNTDVSYLADYFPGCTITQTTAFELCPKAGDREQLSKYTLLEAFKNVIDNGIKCTQTNLSRLSGLSQPYISKISQLYGGFEQLKKILLTLINALYRSSNIFSALSEDEIFLVNSYLPLLAKEAPENIPDREDKAAYLVKGLTELVDIVGISRFGELAKHLAPEVIGEFIKAILGVVVPVPVG